MAAIDDPLHSGTTRRLTQQIPAELRGEETEAKLMPLTPQEIE
jgi:hypothetical protein